MWRALVTVSVLSACEPVNVEPPPPKHQASAALKACNAANDARIISIEHALEVVNTLPRPVDGACFVAALPRPLKLTATSSITSAQPSFSRESPRMFVMLDGLTASFVPEGDGAKVLEFGQWSSTTRSIKGEIALPVTEELPLDAAYAHVATCRLCHSGEREERPGVFSSVAFKPQRRDDVSVSAMRARHEACVEAGEDVGACAMFHALFDFGEVQQAAFDDSLPTFGP